MLICDIETDGFLDTMTLMSVGYTYNPDTKEYKEYKEEDINQLVDDINKDGVVVMHNGIGFDKPALEKLTQKQITATVYDTLVAARLMNPDIPAGHSLKQWGKRLGILKGEAGSGDVDEVYGVYTKQLAEYCKRDVEVTAKLYDMLCERIGGIELMTGE